MDYFKATDALYESGALGKIPDNWARTPALPISDGGEVRGAMLFYIASGGEALAKRLLTFDDAKEPRFKSPDELTPAPEKAKLRAVEDYDRYFALLDEYEALLPELFASGSGGQRAETILREIFGDEFFEKLLSPLSPAFGV